MKHTILPAVALAAMTATAGTANAADIRRSPPPAVKAPGYVAPLFTWTGFYVGGNLGYGWGNGSGTVTNTTLAPVGALGPVAGSGGGVLGGVQLGYNWQADAFVFGLETDFQLTGSDGNFNGRVGLVPFSGTTETPWFGTIRGRLGYAADRWLFYVTGGGAYAENKISGRAAGVAFSDSRIGWSWTVGAGVETALTNKWSIKGEYLYIGTPDVVPTRPGTSLAGHVDSHVIRLGVNYHF